MDSFAWLPLLHVLIGMTIFMTLLWVYQAIKKNATIVDVGWSFGMGGSAAYLAWCSDGDPARRLLTLILIGLWSLRLGGYLFYARVLQCKTEDSRYATMRAKFSHHALAGFFVVFQMQSLFVVLFMAPMQIVFSSDEPLWQWHDYLALGFWLVAICGEALADKQLHDFKKNPDNQGKTCQQGLWYYSRHPNYFFEWLHWFAYPLIAWGSYHAAWTWIMPVIMLVFLTKLTGIPYAESQALKHRKDYAAYQRTTSLFFPWFK